MPRSTSCAPALELLDLVMQAHRGTSPDFENGRGDLTDPGTPFGTLLREAFEPSFDAHAIRAAGLDPDDVWCVVVERFDQRYDLGSFAP
jgi:hypothetical protein